MKHRDTLDIIAGAVTGPRGRPETILLGLPVGDELRLVGRTTQLTAVAARRLAAVIRPADSGHPWPLVVKSGALDRFNARRDSVVLTLIEPICRRGRGRRRHVRDVVSPRVRFLLPRPELDPGDGAPIQN